jgi:2-polyprenyl-3-methyl-5-hydroxy-6-metoxy-1,4-benzoquinol methylase
MDKKPRLNYKQFRQVGKEQWLSSTSPLQTRFVRWFGPLGVHARIRNTRVINAIRQLELPGDARILDAGCGHAYATFWLARNFPAWQMTAIELDEKIVEANRLIAEKQNLRNIRFLHSNVSDLEAVSAYDLIFSVDVLEHIPNDIAVLQLFHRALQPEGFLLLHLPRRHQDQWRFFPAFRSHIIYDHVRDEYTVDEIYARLEQTGFEVVNLQYGFGHRGELAFELNNLFWGSKFLRALTALIFFPASVWLAYMDSRNDYDDGNSLLVLARRKRSIVLT